MKRQRCECGGTTAQHTGDEGCWCSKCLDLPEGARCRKMQPVEVIKKPVGRNVTRTGRDHPQTAFDAANHRLPKAGTFRKEVLDLIIRKRGLTDDELEEITCKSHQTVSAARNTLMEDHLVEDSGERRLTRYGNPAVVWKATGS